MLIMDAILLGLVFGLATFLPISADGHFAVMQNLLGLNIGESGQSFLELMLHIGTLLSVCVFCHRDIGRMICEFVGFFRGGYHIAPGQTRPHPTRRMLLMLIISTLFLLIPLAFYSYIKALGKKIIFVGIMVILSGAVLFFSYGIRGGNKNEKNMTVRDAAIIGAAQALAVIPGFSHIAASLGAGIAVGLERDYAVRYSLLLSFFAVLGVTVISIFKVTWSALTGEIITAGILAGVLAGVTACIAIAILRMLSKRRRLQYLSIYCAMIGILTIILYFVL